MGIAGVGNLKEEEGDYEDDSDVVCAQNTVIFPSVLFSISFIRVSQFPEYRSFVSEVGILFFLVQ